MEQLKNNPADVPRQCQSCGKVTTNGSHKFCAKCGEKLGESEISRAEKENICEFCGRTKADKNHAYCKYCGASFENKRAGHSLKELRVLGEYTLQATFEEAAIQELQQLDTILREGDLSKFMPSTPEVGVYQGHKMTANGQVYESSENFQALEMTSSDGKRTILVFTPKKFPLTQRLYLLLVRRSHDFFKHSLGSNGFDYYAVPKEAREANIGVKKNHQLVRSELSNLEEKLRRVFRVQAESQVKKQKRKLLA